MVPGSGQQYNLLGSLGANRWIELSGIMAPYVLKLDHRYLAG
jgi:hypothetical protein